MQISIEGYDFILAGFFYLSHERLETQFNGNDLSWNVAIDLVHPELINAEKSVYLVFKNKETVPVYVGQYTDTFEARWLRNKKYSWHSENVDMKIKEALENGERISIWISLNPYIKTDACVVYNISKEIEEILIEKLNPEWNKVGKNKKSKTSEKVKDIYEKYKKSNQSLEVDLVEKFDVLNSEICRSELSSVHHSKNDSLDWDQLQEEKLRTFVRIRRFIHHMQNGKTDDEAKKASWEEYPA